MKLIWSIVFAVLLSGCASDGFIHFSEKPKFAYLRHQTLTPEDVMLFPKLYGEEYGYLYLTWYKDGVEKFTITDNCRDAGAFSTDTFSVVKLLPGKHRIDITRGPIQSSGQTYPGTHYEFDIKGGEVFVYDHSMGWTNPMERQVRDFEFLKKLHVSVYCKDCESNPEPAEVFDKSCRK